MESITHGLLGGTTSWWAFRKAVGTYSPRMQEMVSFRTPTLENYPKEIKQAEEDVHFSMLDRETLKAIQLPDRRRRVHESITPIKSYTH